MAPGSRRGWTRYFLVLASALIMVPLAQVLASSGLATSVAMFLLAAASVWLFTHRRKLRTTFLLPLIYIPFWAAMYLNPRGESDGMAFNVSAIAFGILCLGALLVDAFWSPYKDDQADMEYYSKFRE